MPLLAFVFVLLMQGAPGQLPGQLPAQQPAPAPGPVVTSQTFGTLLYDGGGVAASKLANGSFKALSTIWNLPDFLLSSRRIENTVDQPDAAILNDTMVKLLPGLLMVGFALVVAYRALSVLAGSTPNPIAVLGGLSVVGLTGLAAVNNRELQRFPIDLVQLLLSTISGAPIREFASPEMHVVSGVDLLVAALFAIAFVLILLFLTVVLFIEGAWCIVLGSQMAIIAIGSALPIFGSGSQFLFRRWLGSLFSPVIVFAALKLMSVIVANMVSFHAPDLGLQFLAIAFGCVAWQAPGLMVGAIAVSFPGVAQMYFAGRLIGAGRFSERAISPGSGAGGSGPRADAPRTRSAPPARISSHGMGSGTAVTNRRLPSAA